MTREELQRCEDLLGMFGTPGWKHIMEDFHEDFDMVSSIHDINTAEELFKNKGKLLVLAKLIAYEETVRRILDEEAV